VDFPKEALVGRLEVSVDDLDSAGLRAGTNDIRQARVHLVSCVRSFSAIEKDGRVTVLWTGVLRAPHETFRGLVDAGGRSTSTNGTRVVAAS
jgi:hypothetical protein